MKTPVSYYGGKGRLAPWITGLFPQHRVYVEPFAGSAAVLFAKPRCVHEIINDVDGGVVTFMRVLREQPEELERLCRLSPYARDEYDLADPDADDLTDLERARQWWVRSSQAFGQVATRDTGWSVSIQRGSNNARSVWNRLERFAAAAERLAGVTIENRDALHVIEAYDDPRGVIYCDPPYLGSTRSAMAEGKRPGGDYRHEFHTDDDHRQLAEALTVARATVFLSGYDSPLYAELLDGWHRAERRVLRRVSNGRSAANPWVNEVIWSNRPLQAEGLTLFAEAAS